MNNVLSMCVLALTVQMSVRSLHSSPQQLPACDRLADLVLDPALTDRQLYLRVGSLFRTLFAPMQQHLTLPDGAASRHHVGELLRALSRATLAHFVGLPALVFADEADLRGQLRRAVGPDAARLRLQCLLSHRVTERQFLQICNGRGEDAVDPSLVEMRFRCLGPRGMLPAALRRGLARVANNRSLSATGRARLQRRLLQIADVFSASGRSLSGEHREIPSLFGAVPPQLAWQMVATVGIDQNFQQADPGNELPSSASTWAQQEYQERPPALGSFSRFLATRQLSAAPSPASDPAS